MALGDNPQGGKVEYLGLKVGKEFIDGARATEKNWLYTAQERGIWRLWWLIYCAVLGINPNTGEYNTTQELKFVGPNAQYALFRVQLARRYIQQRMMLAKDQRLAFEGVAQNNDATSWAEVNMATKAMDYIFTQSRLEQEASDALEALCYFGMSGLMTAWDYDAGQLVDSQEPDRDDEGNPIAMPVTDPQTGEPVPDVDPQTGAPLIDEQTGEPKFKQTPVMRDVQKKSGLPKIRALYPWQIVVDPYLEKDHPWAIVKIPVNKYELAANFKEQYDRIVACSVDDEMGDDALFAWGGRRTASSDTVVLRMYFHRNCAAVPGGRFAMYLKDIPLMGVDDMVPCPLDEGIPVKLMVGARYFGTAYGYPESGDLLSMQTVINEIVSMCVTNIQKRGNANAYKRDDVQIDPRAWSMGGNLIDLPTGAEPPKWDEPPQMDSLSQFLLTFCLDQAKQMLGSNSVVDGNPDANIQSGAFAVLLVNLAQKYVNQIQEAYDEATTGNANDCVELMKKNAVDGFWAEIAGIGNKPYVAMMQADSLKSLHRVKMVRKNPVLSTYVGRRDIFDATVGLDKKDRRAAMTMLLNGDTEPFAADDQADEIRINKENEIMLGGKNVTVMFCDDHALEGPKHRMELNRLRSQDPPPDGTQERLIYDAACIAFEQHIRDHAMALAQTSMAPTMAIVSGYQPFGGMPMGGAPGQGGPGQPQQSPGAGGKPPAGPAEATGKPGTGANSKPQLPSGPSAPKAPQAPQGAPSPAG